MARKPFLIIGAMLGVMVCSGCEVTLSVFVQKDWNTDPALYKDHDLTSKAELKMTRLMGADAKKEVKK